MNDVRMMHVLLYHFKSKNRKNTDQQICLSDVQKQLERVCVCVCVADVGLCKAHSFPDDEVLRSRLCLLHVTQ